MKLYKDIIFILNPVRLRRRWIFKNILFIDCKIVILKHLFRSVFQVFHTIFEFRKNTP